MTDSTDSHHEPSLRAIYDAVLDLTRKVDRMSLELEAIQATLAILEEDENTIATAANTVVAEVTELEGEVAALKKQIEEGGSVTAPDLEAIETRLTAVGSGLSGVATELQSAEPKQEGAVPTITAISPTSGPAAGGNPVVLTGTGFDGALTVTVASEPATVVEASDEGTSLTFTPPAGASGGVQVTVETPSGTATTSYTYE